MDVNGDVDHIMRTISKKCELVREVAKVSKYTIFRVPAHICHGRENLFRPHMLSIGPYYHGREEMREMEDIKLQFLQELIQQRGISYLKIALEILKDLEEEARNCYFNKVDLDRREFLEMLLLDGFFVIQFLIKWKTSKLGDVCGKSWWNFGMIMHDLFLLENQIPFFVLKKLFALVDGSSLHQLAVDFLMQEEPKLQKRCDSNWDIHHLLHLCYLCYLRYNRMSNAPVKKPTQTVPINSATRLAAAGVKFKTKAADGFLDLVDFSEGVLSIPSITIHEGMMYRLANLVALEQCVADVGSDVISYALLMDFLIDTPGDVEILRRGGVVENLMASDMEVADFFNQLCSYCLSNFRNQELLKVLNDVDVYCRSSWHEYRAMLIRNYLGNPWTLMSLAAATVLLVLTFLQTFMSFFPYFHQKS